MTTEHSAFDSSSRRESEEQTYANAESAPVAGAQPVKPDERVAAVDVLRGLALLGILAMNMAAFAWPFAGYENPRFSGGDDPLNYSAWVFNSLFFSGKMMSLFSMLFGAGLILMTERADDKGARIGVLYYRRLMWLLVIGLIHAYLVWSGDILFFYAFCGMLLFPVRRLAPRILIGAGVTFILLGVALLTGFILFGGFVERVAGDVKEIRRQRTPYLATSTIGTVTTPMGQGPLVASAAVFANRSSFPIPKWKREFHKSWEEGMRAFMRPETKDVDKEIEIYQGGYLGIIQHRAVLVFFFQIIGLFTFGWAILGRMLLGMGLMKLGIFSGNCSWRFYKMVAIFGYGFGVPPSLFAVVELTMHEYSQIPAVVGATMLGLGMAPTALGHAAVVMMLYKAGAVSWLTSRLAAVGRMALTNYLVHSILCTTVFYGYGFGWFGRLDRIAMWGLVLAIWLLQLVYSPIWLKYFRYGPAEWLWRTLTYLKRQPMRNP